MCMRVTFRFNIAAKPEDVFRLFVDPKANMELFPDAQRFFSLSRFGK
jgi:carbon monoxide dehydrogenase subunit G